MSVDNSIVQSVARSVRTDVSSGGIAPPLYPEVLNQFTLWWDSSSIVESGGLLVNLINKGLGGSNYDHSVIYGTPNVTTLNSNLCVDFLTQGDAAETPVINNIRQPFTVISVIKMDVVPGDTLYHWDKNVNYVDTRSFTRFDGGQNESWQMDAGQRITLFRDANDVFATYGVQSYFFGANSRLEVSNVGVLDGDAGTIDANYGRVGGRSDSNKTLFGRMGFHGIIERQLTTNESTQLHNYLGNIWGFTWN